MLKRLYLLLSIIVLILSSSVFALSPNVTEVYMEFDVQLTDGICYQETANISSSNCESGMITYSNGTYSIGIPGGWDDATEYLLFDGDWNTGTTAGSDPADNSLIIDYAVPNISGVQTVNNAIWQLKFTNGASVETLNYTIPDSCLGGYADGILRVKWDLIVDSGGLDYIRVRCFSNPTTQVNLYTSPSITTKTLYGYEEGIYWNLTYTPGQDTVIPGFIDMIGYCNATDSNTENISYDYIWYVNNINVSEGENIGNYTQGVTQNISLLNNSIIEVYDEIIFSCRAYDGENYSIWVNSSIYTMNSTAPIMETSRIEPINLKSIDNVFGYCNATQNQGINVNYYYNWFVNGVSVLMDLKETKYCLQETANVSTTCDGISTGLDTGSYSEVLLNGTLQNSGSWYDEDYETATNVNGYTPNVHGKAYLYVNYTVPSEALSNSIWSVAYSNPNNGPQNYTIPNDCMNGNILQFRIYIYDNYYMFGINQVKNIGQCLNDTTWITLFNNSGEILPYDFIYEEAVFWNMPVVYIQGKEVLVNTLLSGNTSEGDEIIFSCLANVNPNSTWLNSSPVYVNNIPVTESSIISYQSTENTLCLQEYHNQTANCPGVTTFDTGDVLIKTPPTYWTNYTNIYDGNYNTYAYRFDANDGNYLINYTVPNIPDLQTVNDAIWQIKFNNGTVGGIIYKNYSLYDYGCFDLTYPEKMKFDIASINGVSSDRLRFRCWTGTYPGGAIVIDYTPYVPAGQAYLFEEAIIWNITYILPINETIFSSADLKGNCNVSDSDNDNVSYYYNWYINNEFILSGFSEEPANYCFQQTANISTECGGLDGGNYNIVGDWHDPQYIYDGNFASYSYCSSGICYFYIDYLKPNNVLNSSLWSIVTGEFPPEKTNLTIPTDCWEYSNTNLTLRIKQESNGSRATFWDCYNGSIWKTIKYDIDKVWEESMYWRYPVDYPQNIEQVVNIIDSSYTNINDEVIFECRGYDGLEYSSWLNSSIFLIYNTMPVIEQAITYPSNEMFYNNEIVGACKISDLDLQNINYSYIWYSDGVQINSGSYNNAIQGVLTNISTLTTNFSQVFKNLIFSCRGYDGYNYTNWLNSTEVYVNNSIPNVSKVITYPNITADYKDNIIGACSIFDENNYLIQFDYNWFINNVSILNGTTDYYNILNYTNNIDLNDDIYFYYTLDNDGISGTTVIDKVGNSNASLYYGAAPGYEGLINESVFFDNINDIIWAPSSFVDDAFQSSSWAISLWVNATTVSSSDAWIGNNAGGNDWSIIGQYSATNYPRVQLNFNDATSTLIDTNITATPGVWEHYVLQHNDDENKYQFYLNGVLTGEYTKDAYLKDVTFGGYVYGSPYYQINVNMFYGRMDETGFWNRSFSLLEIESLYNSGLNSEQYYFINDDVSGEVLINVSTLNSSYTSFGDNVIFSCRAYDELNYSAWLNSTEVYVNNSIPIIQQVITYPNNQTNSTNNITGACEVIDDNDNILNLNYNWFVNNISVLSGNTGFIINEGVLTNISILSNLYINPGDIVIFSCQANDSVSTSSWLNSSILNVTFFQPIVNDIYITPIYPEYNNELHCNFNTTDINPGIEYNVSISWYKNGIIDSTYNYKYVNVTDNILYTTINGTGSYQPELDNYSIYNCTINVSNDVYIINAVSSGVGVYPLENLTILSPLDNTYSNEYLNVTFTVIDYNNDITCQLYVNNSIVNSKSIQNGVLSWLNYTILVDGHYSHYVNCSSLSNTYTINSEPRLYIYDNTSPYISNLSNDENLTTPEIEDNITLFVSVYDLNNVSACQLYMNDTGIFEYKQIQFINSQQADINYTYQIQNYSTKNMSKISWYILCNDTVNNVNISTYNSFTVKDITYPNITATILGVREDNLSVISNYLYNMSFNITFFDNNLFQAFVNVSCVIDGDIYYWEILDINSSYYTIADTVDLSGYIPQKCYYSFGASDDHTKKKIEDYETQLVEKGILFETEAKNKIQIKTKDNTNQYKKVNIKKETDRYNFNFEFEEKELEREFEVYVETGTVYYRPNSGYGGHFVIWNEDTKTGNWLDFQLKESHKYLKYDVNKIAKNHYTVRMYVDIPNNVELERPKFLGLEYGPKNKKELELYYYGMDNIKFDSIGGTNIEIFNYEFYIGGAVNISGIDLYDNATLSNISVNVTNIDTYPGVVGTQGYTVNGVSGIVQNLSNGTYLFEFYKDNQYVLRNYVITVDETLEQQLYETAESVVTVSLVNIKSGQPVYNAEVSVRKNGTVEYRNVTGDNTTSTFIFWLDADTYNITANAPYYDVSTGVFDTIYMENLSYQLPMIFLTTFNLMDEKTLGPFNMNGPDSIRFILICEDSQYTYDVTNQTQTFPIICNYTQFKFDLEYGGESYYRKLIIDPILVENIFNQSIWLIDLNTTSAIYNSLFIDDLLNDYDNVRIFVYKIINSTKEQITADYIDIEGKIGAYLIRNHQYIVEIYSDNHPIKVIGTYSADLEGDKTIRLYDITTGGTTAGYANQVSFVTRKQIIDETLYATVDFNDPENKTSSVIWTLYQNEYGGPVLFTTTITRPLNGSATFQALYNISEYENDTILSHIEFVHDTVGTNTYSRIINEINSIPLEIIDWVGRPLINWFFTLLMGLLAIMATIKTGNMVSMMLVLFGALFVFFGWFQLSVAILALAALVALMAIIKGGTREE